MSSHAPLVQLPVRGMHCASCVARIERVLKALPGVRDAAVNLATHKASIHFRGSADLPAAIAAIEGAGFGVPLATIALDVPGMNCASCVGRVQRALEQVAGVQSASVNLASAQARVQCGEPADVAALIAALERIGYKATAAQDGQARRQEAQGKGREDERRALQRALVLAAFLALPLFVLEMGGHLFHAFGHWQVQTFGQQNLWLVQFALASAMLLGPGRMFFRLGIPALLRGAPDMNSLVALGTAAAFGYSVAATFAPHWLPEGTAHVYYEASALIVALILLGRFLEGRAREKTSEAISSLMQLQPHTARVRRGAQVQEVDIARVQVGDVIELRPGERVPLDGTVLEGSGFVDESMLSGEPLPVEKSAGSALVGGSVNHNGALAFTVTRVGRDTLLAQIIALVEQAQAARLPVQKLVDRITLWFVPAVLGAALLTFALWMLLGPQPALGFAVVNAVAVLLIACPCAMGLAVPISIMVASGRAARLGVLLRKGEALQSLHGARVVALDKTGTLTLGRPQLTDVLLAPGFDEARVLALAAAVEARSEHPIARAIVQAAQERGLALAAAGDVAATPGQGIRARVAGVQVDIGSERILPPSPPPALVEQAAQLADAGKSALYVVLDGQLAALLAVSDPIRQDVPAALAQLRAMGLRLVMCSGDNPRSARAVARQLGIEDVHAGLLPGGKVEVLRGLKTDIGSGTLVYVGDGINDAPALAEAHVGIAVGSGTDIAMETADVVLMRDGLQGVCAALRLARATMRNIRQNLFWAFAYNVALIPVAAGVLYPGWGILLSPVLAAAAMALSDLFVIGNALRLKSALGWSAKPPAPRASADFGGLLRCKSSPWRRHGCGLRLACHPKPQRPLSAAGFSDHP